MLEDLLTGLFGNRKAAGPAGWNVPTNGSPMDIGGSGAPKQKAKGTEHKGLFGMKGNLREVIGILGDALNKGDPIYRPQRQNEKYSDAMQGFGDNPLEAIKRAYAVDRERASKDYDMFADNQRDAQKTALETKRYKTKEAREAGEYRGKMYDRAGRLMNPKVVNEKNWGATKDLYMKVLARNGLEPPTDIPDEYDPVVAERLFSGSIEADDQSRIEAQRENIELSERRVKETEANNAYNRTDRGKRTDAYVRTQGETAEFIEAKRENPEKYRAPPKSGGGRAPPSIDGPPTRKPTKIGEIAISPKGVVWISRNGKTFVKK